MIQRWIATPLFALAAAHAGAADTQSEVERTLETEHHTIELARLADGFERPRSVAVLPGELYMVAEQPGRLVIVYNGTRQEIEGLPEIHAQGHGGLLDILPSPDYANTGWLYFAYTRGSDDATATALVRSRLAGDRLIDVEELFEQNRRSEPGRHYGSRLAWLPDNTLLMSIGDRGLPGRAQDTGDHAGSILRLDPLGRAPRDNPMFNEVGYLPELYSWGHRNALGLAVDARSGDVWSAEPGPNGAGELNLVEPGGNHGWPQLTTGEEPDTVGLVEDMERGALFTDPELIEPVHDFAAPMSPSGLALSDGHRYPEWEGNLIVGDEASGQLYRIEVDGRQVMETERLLNGELETIRDVRQGPNGYLHVLAGDEDGTLYRLQPAD